MFIEDYKAENLPEICKTFFERLNEYILNQHYTDRTEIHYFRDLYKRQCSGDPGNIYFLILVYLISRHGKKDGVRIYNYLTEFTR